MLKIITPNSQIFDEPRAALVKFGRKGLIGQDRRNFIKRASVDFTAVLETTPPKSGEVPVHIIALGSTERYGPNRNGDGFSIETCRRDHSTFRKGHFFRNHQNKDPRKSYGIIKSSSFNEPMSRIELLVYLNGTKEAAERNRGLVADRELHALNSGNDILTSMSTRVPYDVCSGCGHRSKTRAEYCDESTCTKYGGLKNNIGKTFDDGHTLYADNPHNNWFDISNVVHNADRISHVLGYADSAQYKNASFGRIICGAELAELAGLEEPEWIDIAPTVTNLQMLALQKLAQAEKTLNSAFSGYSIIKNASINIPTCRYNVVKRGQLLTAFADKLCLLPPAMFFRLIGIENEKQARFLEKQIAPIMPMAFSLLQKLPDIDTRLTYNPYADKRAPGLQMRALAEKAAQDWSLAEKYVQSRLYANILQKNDRSVELVKNASTVTPLINELANEYALYQVGLLSRWINTPYADNIANFIVHNNYFW